MRGAIPVGQVGVVTLSRPASAQMPAEYPERPDGSVRLRRVAVEPDRTSGEAAMAKVAGRTRQRPGLVGRTARGTVRLGMLATAVFLGA